MDGRLHMRMDISDDRAAGGRAESVSGSVRLTTHDDEAHDRRYEMQATVTTSPWLGARRNEWARECFPEGTLNEAQIRTLLSVEEGGRRVVDLDFSKPSILRVTNEIVEIHTRFGNPRSPYTAEPTYFWLNTDGKMLCAVVEKYEGPQGVHKPGDTYRKWAVGYLRTPDMGSYDKAEEVTYEHMWSIGNDGAVNQIRQHIRDHWVTDNNDDKE